MFVGELTVMIMGAGSFDRVGDDPAVKFFDCFQVFNTQDVIRITENSSEGGILCVSGNGPHACGGIGKSALQVLFQKKTVFCRFVQEDVCNAFKGVKIITFTAETEAVNNSETV